MSVAVRRDACVDGLGAGTAESTYARPVLEIQRSLASLQRWEARSFHAVWVGVLPASAGRDDCHRHRGWRSVWAPGIASPVYFLANTRHLGGGRRSVPVLLYYEVTSPQG